MPKIDLLKSNRDIDEYAKMFIRSFPEGFLYNESLLGFVKGFLTSYQEFLFGFEKDINDQLYLESDSFYLEEFKTMYGLPNPIFPILDSNQDAVFAVAMTKLSQHLISKEDFENFLALLGFNVEFFLISSSILDHYTLPYKLPAIPSQSVGGKNKLTYWIYVEAEDSTTSIGNINEPLPLTFYNSDVNLKKVQNILDFLKPDYLIFKYINLETKTTYGL